MASKISMTHRNITDPLWERVFSYHSDARKQIEDCRRQTNLIKADDIFDYARVVNLLLGPKLQHEQTYLLDPSTSWISAIHSRSRFGMVRCVCRDFSTDLNLRKMDKKEKTG